MEKVLKDLSALKDFLPPPKPAAEEKPAPPPPPPEADEREKRILRESGSAHDLFSRMLGVRTPAPRPRAAPRRAAPATPAPAAAASPAAPPAAPVPARKPAPAADAAASREIAKLRDECQSLRKQCAELQARLDAAAAREAALRQAPRPAAPDREAERLAGRLEEARAEIERLRGQLAQAVRPKGLLHPGRQTELFEGELAEHVREALDDARKAAEQAGRQRRAALLAGLLADNPLSGVLQEKRRRVTALLATGGRLGDKEIAGMEALGFRFVSGKNHHKFKMGDFYVTVSKTPSDYRSAANLITEIKSRFF